MWVCTGRVWMREGDGEPLYLRRNLRVPEHVPLRRLLRLGKQDVVACYRNQLGRRGSRSAPPKRRRAQLPHSWYRKQMVSNSTALVGTVLLAFVTAGACSSDANPTADSGNTTGPPTNLQEGPPAGYTDGHAAIPGEGQAEDVSSPTTLIGTGTPAGCTGDAFVNAVAKGGIITFNCGPDPVTIVLTSTAKVLDRKSVA